MDGGVRQDIHIAPKQFFEILLQSYEVEQRSIVGHFDQQVDVAIRLVFPSRDRTEYANVARAVQSGNREYLLAISFNGHGVARLKL